MAFEKGKMQIVDWWLTKYLPLNQDTANSIMIRAVGSNRIHVLELLKQKRLLPTPLKKRAVGQVITMGWFIMECYDAEIDYWLDDQGYPFTIHVEYEILQNHLEFVKLLHQHKDIKIAGLAKGIACAANVNSVEMVQWLNETYTDVKWNQPYLRCDYTGDLDLTMIKWLEANFSWENQKLFYYTGFRWFRDATAHDQWVNEIIGYAGKNGQLDIVQYLYDHHLHESRGAATSYAAQSGHFKLVKWLHQQNPKFSGAGIEYAASSGQLNIVRWLHNEIKRTACDKPGLSLSCEKAIDKAASFGSLEIVQWLHQNGTKECSTYAMDNAANNKGHLAALQFLHTNRTEGCTPRSLERALYNGHRDVVQWLLHHRPECLESIPTDTMDLAAKEGHLATAQAHLEIVKFLIENGSQGCISEAVDAAAKGGRLATVQYILASDAALLSSWAMENAASQGHFEIVRWLHKNRSKGCTAQAVNEAAKAGHLPIVKYLYEHRHVRIGDSTMREVAQLKQFAVLEWVMKHDPNSANYKCESAKC